MEKTEVTKLNLQIKDLTKATAKLREAVEHPAKSELERDGTIQRFEVSFELAWKCLKSANYHLATPCYSPADCIRTAAQNKIIDDPKMWMEFLKLRNLSTHTYQEEIALEITQTLNSYLEESAKLLKFLDNLVDSKE